ncbi:MAG: NAD(P) transhydrogenase subunit alpha [Deltaproteobacteria bacterium]|nr:MAG: NAD(P) transhydrogenase subunit alpha [Deltaproteobacteria bacterium]
MLIYAPKSQQNGETRTALTPASAKKLVGLGAEVVAQAGLGELSGYSDQEYKDVGVTLVPDDSKRGEADIVLEVGTTTPALLSGQKPGSMFVGVLNPFIEGALVEAAAKANISAFSLDMMPRTTIAQKMDVLSSQANLAGYYSVVLATERLNKILPMMMTPAGTLAPAKVFVIGVGVAGLQAIATARRLGARVQAFDTRPVVEEQVKSLGAKFVKIDLGETGQTDQGYAKELTAEQLEKQRQGMAKVCAQSDIVITTAKLFGRKAPQIVTEDMVAGMASGSIVVDLAAETGGNVAGTKLDEEVITSNGVRIIGLGKLELHVPKHASQMYAANLANFLEHFWDSEEKVFGLKREDEIIEGCLMTHDGAIVHPKFSKSTEKSQ